MKTKNITQLQGRLAVASFTVGCLIAMTCLFFIEPRGEMSDSGIAIVSEFLILAGALLGIKVSFDAKLQKFMSEIRDNQSTRDEE